MEGMFWEKSGKEGLESPHWWEKLNYYWQEGPLKEFEQEMT